MDFARYERIDNALTILKIYRTMITPDQYRALRKQAIAGDPDGALKTVREIVLDRRAKRE